MAGVAVRRLGVALALCLGACGDDAPVVGSNGLNRCTVDADCREGTCDPTARRCVARARTEVFFRIVPPTTSTTARPDQPTLIATLTAPRALRTGETIDLTARYRRVVFGAVTTPLPNDPRMTEVPVPATIVFTPFDGPGVFPAVEVVAQPTLLGTMRGQTQGHTWVASVPDGLFDVLVTPLSQYRATLPPQFLSRFDVRADNIPQRLDIAYPAAFARWEGTVRSRSGALVAGATVRAVVPSRNDLEVSTLATTAAGEDAGHFSVAMGVGAPQDWVLRVASNVNSRGGLVLEVPRAVCARLDGSGTAVDLRLPTDLGLPRRAENGPPCTGCVRFSASVEVDVSAGGTRPLRGVTITFRTRIPLGDSPLAPESSAWFEDRVMSGPDGTFTAWLIPGLYEVALDPPGDDFAIGRTTFGVRDDATVQMGQTYKIVPRIPVEGRVLTNAGRPVANARVRAVPFAGAYVRHACLADPAFASLAARARADEALSDVDGSYRLDVDPGLYRVVVEPPAGSGFATDLGREVCAASRMRALDLVLESPVVVRGVVRSPSGAALPGAQVEAVVRVREAGAPGVSLRVARASAGPNGAYSILLPASTAPSP